MMNPEMITKAVKAAVPLIALAGYELQPDQVEAIVTVSGLVLSIVYSVESWLKNKRGK